MYFIQINLTFPRGSKKEETCCSSNIRAKSSASLSLNFVPCKRQNRCFPVGSAQQWLGTTCLFSSRRMTPRFVTLSIWASESANFNRLSHETLEKKLSPKKKKKKKESIRRKLVVNNNNKKRKRRGKGMESNKRPSSLNIVDKDR